jgi:hypothetical protein
MAGVTLGDFLLIVISAFGGAWANSWYRGREDKRQRKRELYGLLRLIDSEVKYNIIVIEGFSGDKDATAINKDAIESLRTDTWDKVQDKLAQLLQTDDLTDLIRYYGIVRLLKIDPHGVRKENVEDVLAFETTASSLTQKYQPLSARIRTRLWTWKWKLLLRAQLKKQKP